MYNDEIIEEVWKNRKRFSEKYHNDIDAMTEALKIDQQASSRNIVDRRVSDNRAIQSCSPDTDQRVQL